MKKTLLFDFDGTLADSYQVIIDCVNLLSKKYGYFPINHPELLKEKSLKEVITQDLHIRWYVSPFFAWSLKSLLKKESTKIRFHQQLLPTLEHLSKYFDLAILSSNHKNIIHNVLIKEQITFFTKISSNHSLFGKDKAIKKFLKRYGLEKNNIIYIGDEIRDIEACKKIGIKIIAVSWGFNSKNILEKYNPDYLIESPEELINIAFTF